MSSHLHARRVTNAITYTTLRQHDPGGLALDSDPDEEATKEENARDFYSFESSFPFASGTQGQLETYAATQESLAQDERQGSRQDDLVWNQIQQRVRDDVAQLGTKMRNHAAEKSMEGHNYDPVAEVCHYTTSITNTGIANQLFRASVIPSTISEWLSTVSHKTNINILVERWLYKRNTPRVTTSVSDSESSELAARADALYDHLARHHCGKSEHTHKARLQLSGWSSSFKEKESFEMFLSMCSDDSWHKTVCAFESAMLVSGRDQIPTCSHVPWARKYRIPLLLSFNNESLWKPTPLKLPPLLQKHQLDPRYDDFETLLMRGDFKTSDLNISIGKFYLAFRLALSLQSLHLGPWIQQDWSSNSICFVRGETGSLAEIMNGGYISCDLRCDRAQSQCVQPPNSTSAEPCPSFFLSLAQLLVEIANGEKIHRPLQRDDTRGWYDSLADELQKNTNTNDRLMEHYWKAVQGCLFYEVMYGEPDEDKRLRGQKVIHDHIVFHLRNHLAIWEKQKQQEIDYAKCSSKASQSYSRTQRSDGPDLLGNFSSAMTPSTHSRATSVAVPSFNLWSDTDDDWGEIGRPSITRERFCFQVQMREFLNHYITPKETQEKDYSRVCVAIIDTGLYIEEGELGNEGETPDPLLSHPNMADRVTERRNFFSPDDSEPDADDWRDEYGHGTHVARLVLRFAPQATVVVAKISSSRELKTRTKNLVKALEWAGERSDIINMSFSLGEVPEPQVCASIERLVASKKLIFVAASNKGGYSPRPWPANGLGVFAIHATTKLGQFNEEINPWMSSETDNFGTWGCAIDSYWNGGYQSISGTSFATPVAAAITANILEFTRRTQPEEVAENLTRYSAMRRLFREHMTAEKQGNGHLLAPWKKGLWDGKPESWDNIGRVLREVTIY